HTRFVLTTRAYAGARIQRIILARIVDESGQTRSVTVIGFPEEGAPLPILGVDLIAFRSALSLVALDYAPTNIAYWRDRALPVLKDIRCRALGHLKLRKRPAFTDGSFSDAAIIAGCPKGNEPVACEAAAALVTGYLEMAAGAMDHPSHPSDRSVAHWCAAELGNRREHDALAGIFGDVFAEDFLNFLFGDASRSGSAPHLGTVDGGLHDVRA
ncbi:MAG: hypothetical protein AAFX94_14545, partial [Myxococcota bacterium]